MLGGFNILPESISYFL